MRFVLIYDIADPIYGLYSPLGAFVARQPLVADGLAVDIAGLEKTKNVARELRNDAFFSAKTSCADDGA